MLKVGNLFFPDGETHFTSLGDQVLKYGKYDRLAAYKYVKDWRLAIDIGANVGIFSWDFSHRFKKVLAFEPMPATRECLEQNVRKNVRVMPYALSDAPATLEMYQTDTSGASFVTSHPGVAVPFGDLDPGKVVKVKARTLDSFTFEAVDLIKIDIQGAEYPALLGARETILRHRPVLMVEEKAASIDKVGPEVHAAQAEAIARTADLLRSYGMTPKEKAQSDRIYVFDD
ncbi:MAG TPA: FkbM family methyltransferase [Sphingomicrobium sp.]|jgi:FkbM family methyltransferase